MKRLACFYLPAVLLVFAPAAVMAAAKPIRLQDYRALVRIDSPRFSPDGRQIAFLTVRPDMVHDRYDATLRVLNIADGKSRALVRGMRGLHMPRWSPHGQTLAFVAKVGKQKAQIFTVPAAGGTPAELSDANHGVQQFAWSPDGKTIAYVTPDDSPTAARCARAPAVC